MIFQPNRKNAMNEKIKPSKNKSEHIFSRGRAHTQESKITFSKHDFWLSVGARMHTYIRVTHEFL